MPHEAIRPVAADPVRGDPGVRHDRYLADAFTGILELAWSIDPQHPVAVGAGWHVLVREEARRIPPRRPVGTGKKRTIANVSRRSFHQTEPATHIVAAAVQRNGIPVLPGSSLKGAVRQAFELLTPSCRMKYRETCFVKARERLPQVCPACSLFGAAGWASRVTFGEAAPACPGDARLSRIKVPTAWGPKKPVAGRVRIYGLGPATQLGEPAPTPEWAEVVEGRLRSRLWLSNVREEELGILLCSLGFGAPPPSLRLGGKKFHGLGAVNVAVSKVDERFPGRRTLEGDGATQWAKERVIASLLDDGRRATWEALHRAWARTGNQELQNG